MTHIYIVVENVGTSEVYTNVICDLGYYSDYSLARKAVETLRQVEPKKNFSLVPLCPNK